MNQSNSRDSYSGIWLRRIRIACIAEIAVIFILTIFFGKDTSDTPTYFEAWDTLLSGQPHFFRTPLYPLLIGTVRAVVGVSLCPYVVWLIQAAIFLLSIDWFLALLKTTGLSRRGSMIFCAVYALLPGPLTFVCTTLTESLALSGTVLVLWLTIRALNRGSARDALLSALVVIALLALRPSFLYMPCILALFWIVALLIRRCPRQVGVAAILGIAASFVALGLYCAGVKSTYGFFSPSGVSAVNNYFTVRQAGTISGSMTSNPRLAETVDSAVAYCPDPSIDDIWAELPAISALATPAEMMEITSGAMRSNPGAIAKYIATVRLPAFSDADAIYGGSLLPPVRLATRFCSINNGTITLLLMIFIIALATTDIRRRSFNLPLWLCGGCIVCCDIVVALGAPDDFARLLLPNFPCILLITAWLVAQLGKIECRDTLMASRRGEIGE